MNKVSFVLKYPKEKKSPIIMLYTCSDGVLKYATGFSYTAKYWDKETQLPLGRFGSWVKEAKERIELLTNMVEDYVLGVTKQGRKVRRDELQTHLRRYDGKSTSTQGSFFIKVTDLIRLAEQKEITFGNKHKHFSAGTLVNWNKTANLLKEFNPSLTFESITMDTYQRFINFCNSKGYSLNYTGSLIKDWKAIMNHARSQGWHTNSVQNNFKKGSEDTSDIYLSEVDLDKLRRVEGITDTQVIIRDRFLLNCKMGLRISDMSVFEQKAIIKDGKFTIANRKTGKAVTVPLTDEYYYFLEKYKGKLPQQYNKEFVNRELKVIAQKAGITDQVLVMTTKGGTQVNEIKEKWELISNHTARRTFVTHYLNNGGNSIDAERLAGMSAPTVRKYDKRSPDEVAESAKSNAFFARKPTPQKGG